MTWSIVDVARMSGVTARTLRHYDGIGLVPPTEIGSDGYRRYDGAALLRLQHVLVLRALGLPLREIQAVLDAGRDELTTLREHRDRLLAERERLGRMAATVERSIEDLQQGRNTVTTRPESLFDGFQHAEYAEEARARWPEEAASSEAYVASLTPEDTARLQREFGDQMIRMAALRDAGHAPAEPGVQAEVDLLHRRISRMWTPDAAAFTGLGRMYVDDERFRATYDAVAPGLAEYYRDAMVEYAGTRLS